MKCTIKLTEFMDSTREMYGQDELNDYLADEAVQIAQLKQVDYEIKNGIFNLNNDCFLNKDDIINIFKYVYNVAFKVDMNDPDIKQVRYLFSPVIMGETMSNVLTKINVDHTVKYMNEHELLIKLNK